MFEIDLSNFFVRFFQKLGIIFQKLGIMPILGHFTCCVVTHCDT
jgi:hypothetical protein